MTMCSVTTRRQLATVQDAPKRKLLCHGIREIDTGTLECRNVSKPTARLLATLPFLKIGKAPRGSVVELETPGGTDDT